MRGFSLFLSAAILMAGSTFAHAEKPRQAPPAMTEQEIKDYIDAQVDKVVKERMPPAFSTRDANPDPRFIYPKTAGVTVQACPAGGCPDGCVDNGDGTCSCPAGTSCGSCASCGMSQYAAAADGGATADDGGGSCANGSCGKSGPRRHFLGRIFGRRRRR